MVFIEINEVYMQHFQEYSPLIKWKRMFISDTAKEKKEDNMYSVLSAYNWPLILFFSFISILLIGFLVYYFTLKIKAIKKILK